MKMQLESKFYHDARAFKYKFDNSFLASEASQKNILDFDVSNMPISEFWVTLLETDYFFTVPLSKIIFSVKIRARKFFSTKNQAPPPPPENVKWTVHKKRKIKNLAQYYENNLLHQREIEKAKWQHQKTIKMFGLTAIAGQIRTVRWRI